MFLRTVAGIAARELGGERLPAGLSDRWRQDAPSLAGSSLSQQWRYAAYVVPTRHVLLDNVIAHVDAQGVEVRHPFHDLRLTRFLMGAAGGMLRRGQQPKHLLREAMRQRLPEAVRPRQMKTDFSMPIVEAVVRRLQEHGVNQPAGRECRMAGWAAAGGLPQDAPVLAGRHRYRAGANGGAAGMLGGVSTDLWLTQAFRL
ncbi:asparagine synthase-related protein [Solimonas sp. SE-A11]|uniref:asparagine synthase-related protein n=1 Tax=Solimonas sp. SE-A11 TaxID=3054954 RepID=UPI00259C872B|nr:asparagine synthase-related protein [Solimonas sp. SE-A11]MDM4772317.1 asparagine synthase-related protein [Solimonas sp. SE-A11]